LIEVLLFAAIPRRDVRTLAKQLILGCGGGITNVFWADPARLRKIPGISSSTIATIMCVRTIVERVLCSSIGKNPITNHWPDVINYLRVTTKHSIREYMRVLYLNKKQVIVHDTLVAGTVDRVTVYVREIVKQAMDVGAVSMVIAHNHVSDDPKPSEADLMVTERLSESCKFLGLTLLDHIIVSESKYFSFREEALL